VKRDDGSGTSNFLLGLILLSVSGVPVLAGVGSALGITALFAGMFVAAAWQYIFVALLAWGAWRFLCKREEAHRRVEAERAAVADLERDFSYVDQRAREPARAKRDRIATVFGRPFIAPRGH
jgi:hypothetical protein